MANRLQLRRDTAANWDSANPTLADGEPAFEIDTLNLKIGDGITKYRQLDYFSPTATQEINVLTLDVRANGTIAAGDCVMFDGISGSKVLVVKADTSASGFRSDYIIGVSPVSAVANDDITVTEFGTVTPLDTSGFSAGDILYIDPASAGTLTNVQPSAPNYSGSVAAVLIANPTGSILVRPITAFNLSQIVDVEYPTTPATNDLLVFNATSGTWQNKSPASADLLTRTVADTLYEPLIAEANRQTFYRQDTQPSGGTYREGDMWYKTDTEDLYFYRELAANVYTWALISTGTTNSDTLDGGSY